MARKVKVSSVILNIRLHPHTDELYRQFIEDLFDLKQIVRLHGDRHGMISLIDRSRASEGTVTGTITTFTVVEIDGEWFDAESLAEASDDQVSEVRIPRNLHPNAASFFFHFDIKRHRLFVQNYSKGKVLTPQQALTLFKTLSEHLDITQKYTLAKITLVQSQAGLESLFSLDRLDRITITIMKPNADILSANFVDEIEGHLAAIHARKLTVSYVAEPGDSLVPDQDMRKLSAAALENGNVEAIGRDGTGRVKRSTEDFPLVLQDRYDPDDTTEHQAFRRLVAQGTED